MDDPAIVEVQNASGARQVPGDEQIGDWVRHVIAFARPGDSSPYEIVLRIVDEDEGRALNQQFRHVDKATNVLAFPAGEEEFTGLHGEGRGSVLGDLVICAPVVLREAAQQGKSAENHWFHLLAHGTLHLLGYGHESERQAAQMESLETRILAAKGIDDPYRDR
jgi:probable rRNA maturation factor